MDSYATAARAADSLVADPWEGPLAADPRTVPLAADAYSAPVPPAAARPLPPAAARPPAAPRGRHERGVDHRPWSRRALLGWTAGVVATGVHDCLRLSLAKAGVWDDPVPLAGQLLLVDPHVSFLWGYVWRLLGSGGGAGLAFAMLPWRGVRSGILYGTTICLGLFAVLAASPVAQTHLVALTPVVAAGTMAGHWVYGAVLGLLTSRWLPPVHAADLAARPVAGRRAPGHVASRREPPGR